MGILSDRQFRALYQDNKTAAETRAADTAASETEYAQAVAGKYTTTLPTLADGDFAFFRLTSDGKLMVDTEMTVDGDIIVNNLGGAVPATVDPTA